MRAERERAFVGLFILIAAGLLVATLLSLSGVFDRGEPIYRAYFRNAGGLAPGSEVRYGGGPPVGRVVSVRADPKDATRMEIKFRVERSIPVKTDSKAKIASIGLLGDNFIGIVPGSESAPLAVSGSVLPSEEYVSFDEFEARINDLTPQATALVQNLNARVTELKVTVERVNALLDERNRANIAETLANARGMLAEDRPALRSTLNNLDNSSAKVGPLLDDFKKSVAQANTALSHVNAMVTEDRPDLRQAIAQMRAALTSAAELTDQLNGTLNANSDNLADIIENVRDITANLKAFSETIETRPSSLIRTSAPREHVPGQMPKHPD